MIQKLVNKIKVHLQTLQARFQQQTPVAQEQEGEVSVHTTVIEEELHREVPICKPVGRLQSA